MLASRYELQGKIGNGAFAEVLRATDRRSDRLVAVKRLRVSDDGRLRTVPAAQFQELEALRQLRHPNVVQLVDVLPDGSHIALVLEYMPVDLFSVLRRRGQPFDAADTRGLLRMLLQGVACCHDHNILHRDLKPGNLLLSDDGVLKLSDFGLATVFVGCHARSYSHQVATRWYRAPELLFGARQYDSAVDMWAVGAVAAELLRGSPLFAGQNDLDQLFRVVQVLGDPETQWPGVTAFPDFGKVSFPAYELIPLRQLFPDVVPAAVDLLTQLLAFNPSQRLSARQALAHDFFFEGPVRSRFSGYTERDEGHGDNQELAENVSEIDSDNAFLASLGKPLALL